MIKKIKLYWYYFYNLLTMIVAMIRWHLKIKYDKSVIPEGIYCYAPDMDKNTEKYSGVYYIIPCPYYKAISKYYNGCMYLGFITDDSVFDDQCKMCGENYGFDEIED